MSVGEVPSPGGGFSDSNPLLSVFQDLDISTIFQLVATLLTLLLVYDSISGEKENRTLGLMLSQGLGRHQVLLGKLAGCLISMALTVTLGLLIACLILYLSPTVALSTADWSRVAVMYAASLLLVACFCTFGLFVSALTKHAADTLVLLFFFWVVTTVVVPDCAGSLAERLYPAVAADKVESAVREINSDMDNLEINWKRQHFGQSHIQSDDRECSQG